MKKNKSLLIKIQNSSEENDLRKFSFEHKNISLYSLKQTVIIKQVKHL